MLNRLTRPLRNRFGFLLMCAAIALEEPSTAAGQNDSPQVTVPAVSSTGQQSGVTAGYVAQLNQTILPTLVRGPQLETFKALFTDGARLKREFAAVLTDAQIDNLCARTDQWANQTFVWLNTHVSTYAAERFIFRRPGLSMSYNIPGQHADGYTDKWGNCQNALADLLVNLDQLMRDPSIYPEAH